MMKYPLSILFYIKKSKSDLSGRAMIYSRITVNGRRCEFSLRRKAPARSWNAKLGRALGNTPEINQLNAYIDLVRVKLHQAYQKLVYEDEIITAQEVRDLYLGKDKSQKMILEVFHTHNEQVDSLVGREYSAGTAERYKTAKKHLESFVKHHYDRKDWPVSKVDHEFISGFEYYLKAVRKCGHNSATKYIVNFKKIVRICIANKWLNQDPFYNWKARLKKVEREFLTKAEIQRLAETNLHTERLDQVRDVFLFACFTGLAYIDLKKLSQDHITIGIDGEKWIRLNRTKTKSKSNIPLLPTAENILDKYALEAGPYLLPVTSNQKMNAYLKEIAVLCKIRKTLTTHLARHTFATTITLSNGVPLESVSKMLGHQSVRTTQHYAKILDLKLSEDMKKLKQRIKE